MTRSAAEIGAGLLPARPARPIETGSRLHVIGAAGAGASAAALLAHHAGASVSGCDAGGESPYTPALAQAGIPLAWRHSAEHLGDSAPGGRPQRLAVTKALTSVAADHPELVAARRAGIPLEPWQQLVADAAATRSSRLVAVAGTHGKSTTSGWLVDLLVRAGRDPSAFVGALLPAAVTGGEPATARWGGGDAFVVEADEYAGNFDAYRPEVAVLLNVEWDHPDVFADQAEVEEAFVRWLRDAAVDGRSVMLVANVDDPGVVAVCRKLAGWPGRIVAVGTGAAGQSVGDAALQARVISRDEAGTALRVIRPSGSDLELHVSLPGDHNVANALAVVGAAYCLAADDQAVRDSLASFGGVGRRLELKGEVAGVTVLDDYGHHPTAIARTIAGVRQRYPARALWAVYEPLTYHRTAAMLDEFAAVLADHADRVVIADIWAGRDPDTTLTSSEALAAAVTRRGGAAATASGSVEQTADYLADHVRAGDVVLVMGGGRSYVIAERLLRLLAGEAR
ncbi:MAG TPA: Mur ligase family protein [Candidatus Limnocylindrales bacterium]|nr:Mur ligase family protein [Candidatus Limnocylindrales bacterium]